MPTEVRMPALSPTMEKGTLARWLVSQGTRVKPGDLLAEIGTDKVTMEFESIDEGVISSLIVPAGTDDIAVGSVIALIADEKETASGSDVEEEAAPPQAGPIGTAARAAQPEPLVSEPLVEATKPAEVAALRPRPSPAIEVKVKVSPLAQRIADAKGIDLSGMVGSGPDGRIIRADLGLRPIVPLGASAPATDTKAAIFASPPNGVPADTIKLSGMRKTIARRLTEAKQTVPHFYLTVRCVLDPLLKLRDELNESLAQRGIRLSVNDILIKAMTLALIEVPEANVQFAGEELHRFLRIDIAMAVAVDGGLITPVIRDAGTLSLSAIATRSRALAAKARDGKLAPEDYQGGTASISNLGMFGIDEMIPVINPPQALILGIGAGIEQPWKVDGRVGLATVMAATASFDHRAIDGACAARFMSAFRSFTEAPIILLG